MSDEVRSITQFLRVTCDVIAMETKKLAGVPEVQGGPTKRFTQAQTLIGIRSITDQPGSKSSFAMILS